jgi:uncharacterized protein YeaO (DUF488 family)
MRMQRIVFQTVWPFRQCRPGLFLRPGDPRTIPIMAIRIVRLGSPRAPDEGLRLGTVRRPPRGVRREDIAARNFYDVWVPGVAPTELLLKQGQRAVDDERRWKMFARAYQREMKRPDAARLLDLLAALSHGTDFSVGCYCEDESRCHRSLLRRLLQERGAAFVR